MGKNQSKLKSDKVSELSSKTHFSEAEVKQWFAAFIKDCPNGALNREDFIEIYGQFFPFGQSSLFASKVFESFDTKNVGMLTFEEYITSLSAIARGSVDEKLTWVFKLYDVNKNGKVEIDELEKIVEAVNKMVGIRVEDGDADDPAIKAKHLFDKMAKKPTSKSLTLNDFRRSTKKDASIERSLTMYDGVV